MAEEGIIFATLGLPLYTVIFVFQYFYQAYGRFKLANFFAVANNFLFIVPIALFLVPIYGIMGLWLSFLLSRVVGVFAIFIITCWHCKRITFDVEDYLLLPEDFDLSDDKKLDMTVTSKAEVLGLSERAQSFCEAQGIDDKRSMFAGICIEEMAGNIVDYGFNDGKNHFVDVRIIINGSQVIIRIRDNCRAFDPKKWVQIHNPEDPSSHIGIRLVRKIATEFKYLNVLKLNNLTVKI
jgi:anti-sigma regulatory factor (Ser/Thr protein kinase)